MGIYLFCLMLIQRDEAVQNVIAGRGIVRSTFSNIRFLVLPSVGSILVELAFIVWKVVLHWADRKLLLKSIDLVQEQDDGGFDKPARIAD